MPGKHDNKNEVSREVPVGYSVPTDGDVDLTLLKDSLAKTPWERMQANDDALNFGESLHAAMKERHAKLK